jgi:hypothetical protein
VHLVHFFGFLNAFVIFLKSFLTYFPYFEKKYEAYEITVLSVSQRLKAGIVEPEKTAVARQRLRIQVTATTNTRNSRRAVGRGVFCVVGVVSNSQYVVRGK